MASSTSTPKVNKLGIAGAGGIGSFVAANLFNYGAIRDQFPFTSMQIDIFDDDIVDASNLLHQNFADEDVGKYKADLCADKFGMTAQKRFMTKKDFKNYDVVISCVDSMTFRKDLYEYGFENPELFWIDGRCTSRSIGLMHSKLPKASLEQEISNSKERTGCLLSFEKEKKISHVTPQIVATMIVQTYLNYIRGDLQAEKIKLII